MIRKLIKFLKKCWGKKAAYAYAGLMLTACILTYKLYFASGSNIFKSEEEKASVASSVAEGKIAYGEKNIIQGDITDRNDTVIMTSDSVDGYAHYKDAEAYTQAIGFASKDASYLLGKTSKAWLYDALPGTNKGCTIQTTLDSDLQEYCYSKLKNVCTGNGAGDEGSIVVLEAKTGRVLTWAYTPSFDVTELLTAYAAANHNTTTWENIVENTLHSETYPMLHPRMPGSVFKILTSIGIIEKGESCLRETVYDGTGYLQLENSVLPNAGGQVYGEIGFKQAFMDSVNVYFAKKAIEDVGKDRMDELAERCSIGTPQYFDFGMMLSKYDFNNNDEELARTAIGQQNVQMSAMHVAMLTMGAACDGQIAKPHMIQQVYRTKEKKTAEGSTYSKGEIVQEEKIDTGYMHIMSPETSEVIRDAMEGKGEALKQESGMDLVVNGQSIGIGCKTGTGQIDGSFGGYSGYNNIWLTSYVPADDPQYIIVLNKYKVDGSGTSSYGATMFEDLIDVCNRIYNNNHLNPTDNADETETDESDASAKEEAAAHV